MNYTIKNEKTYLNRVYHTNDKVVYKINNTRSADVGGEDAPIIYDKNNANNELFITIAYNEGNPQYINLENYIGLGTTINGTTITTIEGLTLAEMLQAQQEEEMTNQILNGADPKEVYDSLPAFIKGPGTQEIVGCSKIRTVTAVTPPVTVTKPCDDEGNLTNTFVTTYIVPNAQVVAQKAVDDYVSGLDTNVKLEATVTKKA